MTRCVHLCPAGYGVGGRGHLGDSRAKCLEHQLPDHPLGHLTDLLRLANVGHDLRAERHHCGSAGKLCSRIRGASRPTVISFQVLAGAVWCWEGSIGPFGAGEAVHTGDPGGRLGPPQGRIRWNRRHPRRGSRPATEGLPRPSDTLEHMLGQPLVDFFPVMRQPLCSPWRRVGRAVGGTPTLRSDGREPQ